MNDEIISDDYNKLSVIHNQLIFACGGNKALTTLLNEMKDKITGPPIDVESFARLACDFLQSPGSYKCLIPNQCAVVICGIGLTGNPALSTVIKNENKVVICNAPYIVCPPADMNRQACEAILTRNFDSNPRRAFEQTIIDISSTSKYVSKSGNKWEYESRSQTGTFSSF